MSRGLGIRRLRGQGVKNIIKITYSIRNNNENNNNNNNNDNDINNNTIITHQTYTLGVAWVWGVATDIGVSFVVTSACPRKP